MIPVLPLTGTLSGPVPSSPSPSSSPVAPTPAVCGVCGAAHLDAVTISRRLLALPLTLSAGALLVVATLSVIGSRLSGSSAQLALGVVAGFSAVGTAALAHRVSGQGQGVPPTLATATCPVCGCSRHPHAALLAGDAQLAPLGWRTLRSDRAALFATVVGLPQLFFGLFLALAGLTVSLDPAQTLRSSLALWGLAAIFLAMGLHTTGRPWVFRAGDDEARGTTWAGFFGRGEGVTTSPWLRPTELAPTARLSAGEGAGSGLRDSDKDLVETLESLAARRVLRFATRDQLLWSRLLSWRKVTLVPIGLQVRWNERAPFAADEPELADRLVQALRLAREERLPDPSAGASAGSYRGDERDRGDTAAIAAPAPRERDRDRSWDDALSLVELLGRVGVPRDQAARVERGFVRELASLTASPSFLRRLPLAATTTPTDEGAEAPAPPPRLPRSVSVD
jgi:hypothetical protein